MKAIPEIYINFSFWSLPGPPDPPRNCTLTNQTHDSLQVDCQEGFGSGLSQEFHMEVFTDLQVSFSKFCRGYQNLQYKYEIILILLLELILVTVWIFFFIYRIRGKNRKAKTGDLIW